MAIVRFLTDYRGELTAERYYEAGESADFPAGVASALAAAGRVKLTEEPEIVAESKAPAEEMSPDMPAPSKAGKRKKSGA